MNDDRQSTNTEESRLTEEDLRPPEPSSKRIVENRRAGSNSNQAQAIRNLAIAPQFIDIEEQDNRQRDDIAEALVDHQEPWVNYVGLAAGIGAFVCLIIAAILTIVLSRRHSGSAYKWQLAWITLGASFSLWVIIWVRCFGWNVRRNLNEWGTHLHFPVLMFLTALYFAGYLFVNTIWFIFYRQTHYDNLVGLRFLESDWSQTFGSRGLPEIIRSSSMVILCIALLMVIAFLCYLFICDNFLQNRYQTVRYALYFSSGFMAISAWIVVYWAEECFEYEGFFDERPSVGRSTRTLKGMAITAVILSGIAAAINLLRSKSAYIILALVLALQFTITVGATGMIWRLVRKAQAGELSYVNTSACTYTMQTMSEAEFHGEVCPYGSGKYLPDGYHPYKAFLTKRWERGNFDEIRSLNPACCLTAKYYYIWPFMQLGYWGLVLSVSCFAAFVFSIWLISTDDYPNYYLEDNKMVKIADIATACLLAALALLWCLHFLARKKNFIDRNFTFSQLKAYMDPDKYPLFDFSIVPKSMQDELNEKGSLDPTLYSNGTVCFSYDNLTMPYPTFLNDSRECSDPSQCSIRVAVASTNSKLISNGSIEGLNIVSVDNKNSFFPDCVGNLTSYYMVSGPEEKVREFLRGLQVCTMDLKSIPTLGYYKDQVIVQSNVTGLKETELLWNDSDQKNSSECMLGFTKNITLCNSRATCRYFTPLSKSAVFRTLKGHLFRFFEGEKIDLDNPYIVVYASSGKEMVGNGYTSYVGGYFVIRNIPIFANASYLLTIEIKDPKGVFLNKTIDLVIFPTSESLLSMGEIQLLTKDAGVCDYNDFDCKRNQQHLKGSLNLTVHDGSYRSVASKTLGRLSHATVVVSTNFTYKCAPFITVETDSEGHATIPNLPYGSYTISVSKQGYASYVQTIELQDQYHVIESLILDTEEIQEDARLTGSLNSHNTDGDLVLQIRSDSGHECEVSPYFKFCGYAAHAKDSFPQTEEERIYIRRLSIATYNLFFFKAPPYNLTCSTCDMIFNGRLESHLYGHESPSNNIDWSSHNIRQNLTKTSPTSRYKATLSNFQNNSHAQLGGVLYSNVLFYHARNKLSHLLAAFSQLVSDDSEEILKILPIFNFLGIPLFGEQRFFVNTSYAQEDRARDGLVMQAPAPVIPVKVQEAINEMGLNQTVECNPYLGICLANQNCTNPPPLSSNCTETTSTYSNETAVVDKLDMNYTLQYGYTPLFTKYHLMNVLLPWSNSNNTTTSINSSDSASLLTLTSNAESSYDGSKNFTALSTVQQDRRNKSGFAAYEQTQELKNLSMNHSPGENPMVSELHFNYLLNYTSDKLFTSVARSVFIEHDIRSGPGRLNLSEINLDMDLDSPVVNKRPIGFTEDDDQIAFTHCSARFSYSDYQNANFWWDKATPGTPYMGDFPGQTMVTYSNYINAFYATDPVYSKVCSLDYKNENHFRGTTDYQFSTWHQRPFITKAYTTRYSTYYHILTSDTLGPASASKGKIESNVYIESVPQGDYINTNTSKLKRNDTIKNLPYRRQEVTMMNSNRSLINSWYYQQLYNSVVEYAGYEEVGDDFSPMSAYALNNPTYITASLNNSTELWIYENGSSLEVNGYYQTSKDRIATCPGCSSKYLSRIWNGSRHNESRAEESSSPLHQYGHIYHRSDVLGFPGSDGVVTTVEESTYDENLDLLGKGIKTIVQGESVEISYDNNMIHPDGTFTPEAYFGWLRSNTTKSSYYNEQAGAGTLMHNYSMNSSIEKQIENDALSSLVVRNSSVNFSYNDQNPTDVKRSCTFENVTTLTYYRASSLVWYNSTVLDSCVLNPPTAAFASNSSTIQTLTSIASIYSSNHGELGDFANGTATVTTVVISSQGVVTFNETKPIPLN